FASFVVIPLVSLRPARAAYRNTPYNYNLFFAFFALFAVKFFLPSCSSRPSWCKLHFLIALTADDVNHGKNDDPYAIDKMPVPREHLDVLSVRPRHVSAQAQDQDQHQQDQTHDHVTGMQANERVEGRPEKISTDREVIFEDQSPPFDSGRAQERH